MPQESHATLEDSLIHEVWQRNSIAVQCLLASGANPNLPGRAWSSAIACAGENADTGDIIRMLVTGGAQVNLRNTQGLTPLHYAVDVAIDSTIQQNLDEIDWSVVGVFLDLGADPTLRDNDGRTVYDLASAYGGIARKSLDDFMESRVDGKAGTP